MSKKSTKTHLIILAQLLQKLQIMNITDLQKASLDIRLILFVKDVSPANYANYLFTKQIFIKF